MYDIVPELKICQGFEGTKKNLKQDHFRKFSTLWFSHFKVYVILPFLDLNQPPTVSPLLIQNSKLLEKKPWWNIDKIEITQM